ncbi:MAG: hypothetical protein ACR2JZ_06645 [Candidatus Limnocylindrales bacterium]
MSVPIQVLVALLLAALLLAALLFFLRRASQALNRTREVAGFQREAQEVGERVDGTLLGLIDRVDQVRHGSLPAAEIHAALVSGVEKLEGYLVEVQGIAAPRGLVGTRERIATDIERGIRALQLIEHGAEQWEQTHGRRSELEAQTSIKRGYLNLLHAREESRDHLADLAAARDASRAKWRSVRTEDPDSEAAAHSEG